MKKIGVHIKYLIFIILGITMMFLAMYVVEHSELPGWSKMWNTLGWTSFYTVPLYLVNSYIYALIEENIKGESWEKYAIRFLLGIFLSCLVSILIGGILFVLNLMWDGQSYQGAINWLFSKESLRNVRQILWISGTIACILYTINFIFRIQNNKLKEQKQKVVQISTEHESLKSQIGPHFLFNSLNVLNGLIDENPDKAQEFVSELSSVYRYVLEQKDKSLVSLREEIEFSKTYMNLVQKRFEDGLEFEIEENIPQEFQIIPLSLQILLENCIKHNRISSIEPLKVKVYIDDKKLVIKNNLQIKKQLNESTGKGLQNIIHRFKSFTKREVEINQTETEFIVKLPLLTEKNIVMEINQKFTEEEYKSAKKRVEDLQGFYWNLASYIIVNLFFTFLDMRDGDYDWAFWPLMGWGIGIAFHAIETFGFFNSAGWKDQMVRKELERRQREKEEFHSKFKS
ncbi:histidine kinase [Moheibacter lacus]|uniref:Histidine kinase n=1 Tax=Moheibacter lacus TaxID=2745851 RepID=A0A838ZT83_9FLAO|nr:histidine kinase [Moheibacter lacus]MBA5630191.1 histidine kinase [Moheibacter lacus]